MKLPVAASLEAPKMSDALLPGEMVIGPAGFVETPLGRPVRVMRTVEAKPFCELTDRVGPAMAEPCETDREFVESERAKSGEGGGAMTAALAGVLPPPQPDRATLMSGENPKST